MPSTQPVTTRWRASAHGHLWSDAASWSAGLPGGGEVALFAHGAAGVDLADSPGGAFDVGQLAIDGAAVQLSDGVLHWLHPPYDRQFFTLVGLRIDGGGSLTVAAGAALLGAHAVVLGDVSAATLVVLGSLTDSQVYAGRAGAVSITVEGAGARWQTAGIDQSFQLGGAAVASLSIRAGGRVDDGAAWTQPGADSTMTIGGGSAGASVLVTDAGSVLQFQIIDVGGRYSGSLIIAAGAHVDDLGADVGELGDGTVDVSGAGTVWANRNGLFVHGFAPHGGVTVTDHAKLSFGSYGLQIGGAMAIDATAQLDGAVIVLAGGSLAALATAGQAQSTVAVGQSIELGYNAALGGSNIGNFLGSAAGATLVLTGAITPQDASADPLAVAGGHVVLDNPGNGDFAVALYGGMLETARAGASGSGPISFMAGGGATLQIDQTGTIANPITDFGISPQDLIDLQAVVFTPTATLSWQQATERGGTLLVSDGTHAASLALNGGYARSGFQMAADGHGGTAIGYHGS